MFFLVSVQSGAYYHHLYAICDAVGGWENYCSSFYLLRAFTQIKDMASEHALLSLQMAVFYSEFSLVI